MAAHAYWRLSMHEQVNQDVNQFIVHEIEFLETWAGPNTMVAGVTGTASVSSTFNPALYTAENLIDGDPATRWVSQDDTDSEWFQFVYDTPVEVRAVALTTSIQLAFMPALFDLQWSDDGISWTTAWTATSDYDTWSPFRHTFLEPVGTAAETLAPLSGAGTGAAVPPPVAGTGAATLAALAGAGAGTVAEPAPIRHQVCLTGTWRPSKALNATWVPRI